MTQQLINPGNGPNTHTGDNLPTLTSKVNGNFTELYSGSAQASNGGILKSILSGSFTISTGSTSVTVVVPGMLSTDIFKFFPAPGNAEAWSAWPFLQITSQTASGAACNVTVTSAAAPSSNIVYNYEVAI